MPKFKPTLLIILDGWGVGNPKTPGNPINSKNAPNYFNWLKKFPHTELQASGEAVGLFRGQEGNSEAGHLNLGAGRVVKQDARYVSDAIGDGTFFKNNAFHQALHHVKKYRTSVHLMGLLSNHNSAHSCPEHLVALIRLMRGEGIKKVYLHLFTDGRDSGQHDAPEHLKKLREHFNGREQVASIMGRAYSMDRNKNWERVRLAYEALVLGRGQSAPTAEAALTQGYNSGESDEFIKPTIIRKDGESVATIKDNDAIFFFNLRSDRARELTKALVQPDFERVNPGAFRRQSVPKNTRFVAMTDFGPDLPGVLTAFPSRDITNSLPAVLCPRRQLYIAESEKFAHITYFFNGGYARRSCPEEQWVKIESARVLNFAARPAMAAATLAQHVCRALKKSQFEFMAVNFANADMVGHTGNIMAAEAAVRALDTALHRVVTELLKAGGQGIITADHGNIETMLNPETGEVDSEHSTAPVPAIILTPPAGRRRWRLPQFQRLRRGKLSDVAPTILKFMGIKQPKEMTGRPLF